MMKTIKCQCLTCKKIFDIPKNSEDSSCPDAGCDGSIYTVDSIKQEQERKKAIEHQKQNKQQEINDFIDIHSYILEEKLNAEIDEAIKSENPIIFFHIQSKYYKINFNTNDITLSFVNWNEEGEMSYIWDKVFNTFEDVLSFFKITEKEK